MRKTVTFIKKAAHMVIFLDLVLLFTTGVWAENYNPTTQIPLSHHQQNSAQTPSLIRENLKTDQEQTLLAENTGTAAAPKEMPGIPEKFKKIDFDNSVCFRRCHQVNDFNPSDKTEQQWRMLIEKDGHDIFKKIVWESRDQKEQTLHYLLKHAGGSSAEGIGVWH